MIISADLDLTRPAAELVEELVASGQFDRDEAETLVALWQDPDREPLE